MLLCSLFFVEINLLQNLSYGPWVDTVPFSKLIKIVSTAKSCLQAFGDEQPGYRSGSVSTGKQIDWIPRAFELN